MKLSRTKIAIIIMLILAGGYWYFFMRTTVTNAVTSTVVVGTGSIRTTVKTTGKISPIQTTVLSFSKQGTISKIYKKVGDTVKSGDVIAEIDATSAYLDIESSKISLSNARNSYNKILEGSTLTEKIRSENTLSESRARLTILEKTLENLLLEEKNTLADKAANITTLEQKVEIAKGDLEYAEKNIETDTSDSNIERDTENAYLSLQDIDRIMPDIFKTTKDILHIEDKNSPFYGDFSSKDPGFKTKAEAAYTSLVTDYAKYKSELLALTPESERTFSGTLDLMYHAKSFLDNYATLVGSTMIYAIDASPETEYFPASLHDSYKATLRGYATTLNTKLSAINSTLSTLKSYGTDSLQKLADKNTLAQKKSNLAGAKNDLITAKASLEQLRKSYTSKILSAQGDIDSQRNTIKLDEASYTDTINGAEKSDRTSAQNSIKSAEINLQKAQLSLEDYQIIAPFDGVINDIPWIKGDTTVATEGVLIENKDLYEISLSLDQIDIVKVKSGMPAKIVLDAFPKETYTGSVSTISAVPTETSGVVSYEAKVVLAIKRENIYSKMSATIEITTAEKKNIPVIDTALTTSANGKTYVQLVGSSGKRTRQEVVLGISDATKVEVLSGVTIGDKLIKASGSGSVTRSGSGGSTTRTRNSTFGAGGPPGGF